MVSAWLVPLLRCPETGLGFKSIPGALQRSDGRIIPERDGIASLVYPFSLSGDDARWNLIYDMLAPFYAVSERVLGELITGINMEAGRKEIVSLLGLAPGMRLLEISPGPGVFQRFLRDRIGAPAQFACLDLSINMLHQCRKKNRSLEVECIQGNAGHLPFADESFDALFHFGGVNLFNRPDQALREFVRVVRRGGLVSWGDEQMSESYRHPVARRLLPHINPGFLRVPPAPPEGLSNIRTHVVYGGLGYLVVAQRI